MKAGQALEGFSNGTIWLIVSAFMFATGFIKTGLGKRIAYLLLSRFGKNTLSVAYVMSAADFIIAPFTPSNTARGGGIIYPIVNSVSLALGCDAKSGKNKRTGAFLMYSAYAAVITSACIFMTGASNNVLANTLTEQAFGQSLSWMSWFEVSIIPGLLLSIVTPYLLYKIIKPELTETPETLALAKKELGAMGAMTGKEKVLCVIFIACLVLWATGSIHHIDSAIVALLGLSAMIITHCIEWSDVTKQHGAWDVLVWMGVLVNMAAYLSKFGFMKWFAATMAAACAGMSWMTMLIVLCVIYTMAHYPLGQQQRTHRRDVHRFHDDPRRSRCSGHPDGHHPRNPLQQCIVPDALRLWRHANLLRHRLHGPGRVVEDRFRHHGHAHRGLDGSRPANHGHPRHDVR